MKRLLYHLFLLVIFVLHFFWTVELNIRVAHINFCHFIMKSLFFLVVKNYEPFYGFNAFLSILKYNKIEQELYYLFFWKYELDRFVSYFWNFIRIKLFQMFFFYILMINDHVVNRTLSKSTRQFDEFWFFILLISEIKLLFLTCFNSKMILKHCNNKNDEFSVHPE